MVVVLVVRVDYEHPNINALKRNKKKEKKCFRNKKDKFQICFSHFEQIVKLKNVTSIRYIKMN